MYLYVKNVGKAQIPFPNNKTSRPGAALVVTRSPEIEDLLFKHKLSLFAVVLSESESAAWERHGNVKALTVHLPNSTWFPAFAAAEAKAVDRKPRHEYPEDPGALYPWYLKGAAVTSRAKVVEGRKTDAQKQLEAEQGKRAAAMNKATADRAKDERKKAHAFMLKRLKSNPNVTIAKTGQKAPGNKTVADKPPVPPAPATPGANVTPPAPSTPTQ